MGYNCCFFFNFVPLHIESPYNFGGTGPILGVKNPLQRVNGHAEHYVIKFVSDFRHMHVCGFLWVLLLPSSIKLTATI